jgi:hypothetical protein
MAGQRVIFVAESGDEACTVYSDLPAKPKDSVVPPVCPFRIAQFFEILVAAFAMQVANARADEGFERAERLVLGGKRGSNSRNLGRNLGQNAGRAATKIAIVLPRVHNDCDSRPEHKMASKRLAEKNGSQIHNLRKKRDSSWRAHMELSDPQVFTSGQKTRLVRPRIARLSLSRP